MVPPIATVALLDINSGTDAFVVHDGIGVAVAVGIGVGFGVGVGTGSRTENEPPEPQQVSNGINRTNGTNRE
jgi:hypothetical protein